MKNIFRLSGLLLMFIIAFSACKKSDIEKANDEYDFNSVVPVIYQITGPTTTAASGLALVTYSATPRGGSTFKWETIGHGAAINVLDPSNKVEIKWNQSDVDIEAKIKCIETTLGGISSEPAYLDVLLTKFKPMTFDEFLGEWSGTEVDEAGVEYPINITFVAGPDPNTILFPVSDDGIPALMSGLYIGWGEAFQPEIDPGGNLYATINLNSGAIDFNCQYFGQTLPGPWDYWFSGEGTWEGFNKSMTINFGLQFDDSCSDDYNPSSITLTKQ
jgi:hypothetical protein